MENERKRLYIIMCTLAVAVVGLSIAYAALSTQLTITMSTVQNDASGTTWNVGFNPGTITATVGGTNSTVGRSCGTATATASSVTVANTTLSKPDDSCTYQLQIKNTGSIAATLASITQTAPTSTSCSTTTGPTMTCGNITYKLTTDAAGSTALTTGGTLAATTGTLTVYLSVKYTGTTLSSSAITQAGGTFTLTYNQA
jgi:hypothetical protein